jgi:ParB/RepB/Spo0J family partition protein
MPSEKLAFIPISKIKVDRRTRTAFGDMEGLVESIKDKGIIQPLTISDRYKLLAGERRFRAAKEAGLKEVPCIIRPHTEPVDELEIELIENIFRENFTFDERALHIKKLYDYCATKKIDWSGRKLAKLLNRSTMSVQRDLKLAEYLAVVPELKDAKSQDEALRTIKHLEEQQIVTELRRRQETASDRGKLDMLRVAKANYRIGDTFKGMAELKSGGMIHFIELDPPYAIDLVEAKGGASQRAAGRTDPKVKSYNEVSAKDYSAWMQRMASETYRIANANAWMICWFGMTHFELVKSALKKAGWAVNDIPAIWAKRAGQTAAPEYNLANSYEPYFVCRKGSPVLTMRGRPNWMEVDAVPPAQKYHPTERPLLLMMEIIRTFCLPMQTCFVPCLGSGVTLRACYLNGLKAFGYDLSNEYLDRFLLAVEEDTRSLDKE